MGVWCDLGLTIGGNGVTLAVAKRRYDQAKTAPMRPRAERRDG